MLILQFLKHMRADRRSRAPYLSQRMAVDDRLLMATDAGFRYVIMIGRVRDKIQADRLLRRHELADYRALAVFLHEQRHRPYKRDYWQRFQELVQHWSGFERVDPEQRAWEVYLQHQRSASGHFRRMRMSKK